MLSQSPCSIDSNLKFELHMREKINKAYSILGIIRRNFTYLDIDCFLVILLKHGPHVREVWENETNISTLAYFSQTQT